MKNDPLREISVCIPAHNESTLISRILENVLSISSEKLVEILVCANGCTDDTVEQVRKWSSKYSIIKLIIEEKASKINAWNRLVDEAKSDILLFVDADIEFEDQSVSHLLGALENPHILLASGIQQPAKRNNQLKKRFTGFIMCPLHQEYVYGAFYAFRKSDLRIYFSQIGFNEMPKALSEDIFLTISVPKKQLCIVTEAIAYFIPPSKDELIRYFARGKAQLIDLEKRFPDLVERFRKERSLERSIFSIFKYKFLSNNNLVNALTGTLSAIGKVLFTLKYKVQIDRTVKLLLDKTTDSDGVMAHLTRSESSRRFSNKSDFKYNNI